MTQATESARPDRAQRLKIAAWAATILPLFAFAFLAWQATLLGREVESKRKDLAARQIDLNNLTERREKLLSEIDQLRKEADAQRGAAKYYRNLEGVKIRFYRESDRATVSAALEKLGYRIDTELGRSHLVPGLSPSTIVYGKLISQWDLREIGRALVAAGFPLKEISPATKQADPRLIQIVASRPAEERCALLDDDQLQHGAFENGVLCGRKKSAGR